MICQDLTCQVDSSEVQIHFEILEAELEAEASLNASHQK